MSSSSTWWGMLTGKCAHPEAVACANKESNQLAENDSFLFPHLPDRPMHCIIDMHEVYKAIQYQGDEMAVRNKSKHMDHSIPMRMDGSHRQNVQSNRGERSSYDEDELSTFGQTPSIAPTEARTDITTGTGATQFAANLDRYSRTKPKYNRARRQQPSYTVLDEIQPTLSPCSSASFDMDLRQQVSSVSNPSQNFQKDENTEAPHLPTAMFHAVASGCIPFAPCSGEDLGIRLNGEYYHALHLQLHLHSIDFYRNQFLPMFPKSPVPKGMLRSRSSLSNGLFSFRERPPELVKASSSSSDSTRSPGRGVEFGNNRDVPLWPIKFLVDESSFMDLVVTGSLGLVDRAVASPSKVHKKAPEHYLVVMNRRSGIPLAVCALKSPYGEPVVRIYTTKQRVFGQHPAASTSALGLDCTDSLPLYAWAEFTAEGEFPLPVRYSMYMASGSNGLFEAEPSYRASHKTIGCPDVVVVGRTELEDQFKGCALLSVHVSETNEDTHFASLSISSGIDPILLICFAAIVDETMEKTMRLQCDVSRQRKLTKSTSKQRE